MLNASGKPHLASEVRRGGDEMSQGLQVPVDGSARATEAALRRVNRALRTISACNQALVRATDESQLLYETCRILVEVGGYRLAWVSFAEGDEMKSLHAVAHAVYAPGDSDVAGLTWADTECAHSPTRVAIQTGQPSLIRNTSEEPDYTPWRDEAAKRGYASSIALPLIADARPFGALSLCAAEADAFDAEEMQLLTELADDLAYGIVALRTHAAREQADAALRQERDFAAAVLDTVGAMVIVLDTQGRIVRFNRACEQITGYTFNEVRDQPIWDLLLIPEEMEQVKAVFNELRAGMFPNTHENYWATKDGGRRLIAWSNTAIQNAGGSVEYVIGTGIDITERKRIEAELHHYHEHLQELVAERTALAAQVTRRVEAILNSTHDAIVLARSDGAIEQTNPAFDVLFGYQPDEAFGQSLTMLVEPASAEIFIEALHAVLESGPPRRVELTARRKDGATFDADAAIAPVKEQEGESAGVVVSLRDITHLKEIDRFKSRLIDNVAHDLGNPIANLKVRLYLLRKSPPERMQPHLEVLEAQTQRLERLVDDLRTLSRLDQRVNALNLVPVDLNTLAAEIVEAHKPLAATKNQALVFESGADFMPILADRAQFERAIVNLVANALNYTHEGGQIIVTTRQVGDICACVVRDNGMGIAPEDLPHIFERFYRSQRVKEEGLKGSGLGLAIAHEIVQAHNGRIEVSSELGKGSAFTVWMPSQKLPGGA